MKFLKILLIIIAALIALFVLISIFLPSNLRVERSIKIDAPAPAVFEQINILEHWEEWDPWIKYDTNQVRNYVGAERGVGAQYNWTSEVEDIGNGSLKIIESEPNKYIKMELKFEDFGESMIDFKFVEENLKTTITWGMETDFDFFFRFMGLIMKPSLEKDFDEGLAKLKTIIESSPYSKYQIYIEDVSAQSIYFISDSSGMEGIKDKIGRAYGELFNFMQAKNIEIAGMPLAITNSWSESFWSFDAALATSNTNIKPTGRIKAGTNYSGKAAKVIYIGPYEAAEPAYNAIMKFIEDHNMIISGRSWEVYANDPGNTPPEKLETHIYFPVAEKNKIQ